MGCFPGRVTVGSKKEDLEVPSPCPHCVIGPYRLWSLSTLGAEPGAGRLGRAGGCSGFGSKHVQVRGLWDLWHFPEFGGCISELVLLCK